MAGRPPVGNPIPAGEEAVDPLWEEARGVRNLLCAIIAQATHDIRYGCQLDRATAWRFFFTPKSCFESWCLFLELSADAIRAKLAQEDFVELDEAALEKRRQVSANAIRGWETRRSK